ncbi:MAG: hypothetical protein AAFV27_03715 [Pseudomonadota bacterium]
MSQNDAPQTQAAPQRKGLGLLLLLLGLAVGGVGITLYVRQLPATDLAELEIVGAGDDSSGEVRPATLEMNLGEARSGPLVGPAAEVAAERGTLDALRAQREADEASARAAEAESHDAQNEADRLARKAARLAEETEAARLRAAAELQPPVGTEPKALAETARLQADAERLAAETAQAQAEAEAAQAKVMGAAETGTETLAVAGLVEEDSSAVAPDDAGPDETEVAAAVPEETPAPAPLAPAQEQVETVPERPVIPDPNLGPPPPEFDLIRIEPDGSGLVAGRAPAGARVQILSDGAVIATVEASPSGEFVAFIQIPDNNEGQVLSLLAESIEGVSEGIAEALILPSFAEEEDAPQAPTIVTSSQEEVRVVQPSALGQVDGVTLDSISYDETGAVRVSGRAPGTQPIRIYVDGVASGAAEASAAGTWDATLEAVEEGRYVLRVDALREDGTVASRAESPFQRVFPTAEQQRNLSQITVQPGNTLWVMAQERYGSGFLYTQIFAANSEAIRDPDLIFPGQIFELPDAGEFSE